MRNRAAKPEAQVRKAPGLHLLRGAAVLAVLASTGVQAGNLVINGGFETGDFTGWAVHDNAAVMTTDPLGLGIAPTAGEFMALLHYPSLELPGTLMQLIDFDASNLQSINISVDLNVLLASRNAGSGPVHGTIVVGFFDPAHPDAGSLGTMFQSDLGNILGQSSQFHGVGVLQTGWVTVSGVLDATDEHLPTSGGFAGAWGAWVTDLDVRDTTAMLLVDNVTFDVQTRPVPVPAAVWLLLSGLVSTRLLARRQAA